MTDAQKITEAKARPSYEDDHRTGEHAFEEIIRASEPAAWERLAPSIPVTWRHSVYTRRAHRAGFDAGIAFARVAIAASNAAVSQKKGEEPVMTEAQKAGPQTMSAGAAWSEERSDA